MEWPLKTERSRFWLGAGVLLGAAFAVYYPLLNGGFIWDDIMHIAHNGLLTGPHALHDMWLSIENFQQYNPMQFTTHWLEIKLFGFNTLPFHIISLLLHVANAILLWRLLERLDFRLAWLAAAFFLLHPVHAESAGYLTERRNLLSLLFYLSALHAWLSFDEAGSWLWYAAAWLLFVLALCSKTVACSFPVAVLILQWMRGKLTWRTAAAMIPFFLAGLPLALLTAFMERSLIGANGYEWNFSFAERVLICGRALWFYAGKIVWPHPVMFMYPRWRIDPGEWTQWLWVAGALAALAALYPLTRRCGRRPAAALLFFGVTLFPALGFANVYPQRFSFVADHFQYVASIGMIVFVVGALDFFSARYRLRWGFAAALLLACAALTRAHACAFQSDTAIWQDVLQKTDESWLAHHNYGADRFSRGDYEGAIAHFQKAWQTGPSDVNSALCLGDACMRHGEFQRAREAYEAGLNASPAFEIAQRGGLRPEGLFGLVDRIYRPLLAPRACAPDFLSIYERQRVEFTTQILLSLARLDIQEHDLAGAERAWDRAIALNPRSHVAYLQRGIELEKLGKVEEAERDMRHAAELTVTTAEPYSRLAALLVRKGEFQAAGDALKECLRRDPAHANGNALLAQFALRQGNLDDAETCLRRAIASDPAVIEWRLNLSAMLLHRNKADESIAVLEEARGVNPTHAEARLALSEAYRRAGRHAESLQNLREALTHELSTEQAATIKGGLAWALATSSDERLRDGAEALRLAGEACAASKSARNLDALAAARAESGDFDGAVQSAREAEAAAKSEHNAPLAAQIAISIKRYENKTPFRE